MDHRGTVSFVNDFDMALVKRVYWIKHDDCVFIRGWQGHLKERKWFCATAGSFEMKLLATDSFSAPFEKVRLFSFVLNSEEPSIIYAPGGFLSSFRAVKAGSVLQVYSDCTLEQSKDDDYRFPLDKWDLWKD